MDFVKQSRLAGLMKLVSILSYLISIQGVKPGDVVWQKANQTKTTLKQQQHQQTTTVYCWLAFGHIHLVVETTEHNTDSNFNDLGCHSKSHMHEKSKA